MRKLSIVFLLFLSLITARCASAMLSLELTRGIAGAVPIAIVPFASQGESAPQNVAGIVSDDLRNSGRFKVSTPYTDDYRSLGVANVVVGEVQQLAYDRYQVKFKLLDVFKNGGQSPA